MHTLAFKCARLQPKHCRTMQKALGNLLGNQKIKVQMSNVWNNGSRDT